MSYFYQLLHITKACIMYYRLNEPIGFRHKNVFKSIYNLYFITTFGLHIGHIRDLILLNKYILQNITLVELSMYINE